MTAGVEQLEAAVAQVCAADLSGLSVAQLQELAVRVNTAAQRLTGVKTQVLGELHAVSGGLVPEHPDRDPDLPTPPVMRDVQGWWRDTTRITGQTAGAEVRHAVVLHDLPVLAAAVTSGRLTPAQAKVLGRLHGKIALEDLQASQPQLVTVAAPLNPDALGRWVAHQIATHCEPVLDDEQDKARQRRYLQTSEHPDGTVRGRFVLAAEDAEVFKTVLEPLARKQGSDDTRSAGQRRADALVDVFAGAAAWMDLPSAGGQRPTVTYVMSQRWAAGHPPLPLLTQLGCGQAHPNALMDHTASGAWTGPQTRARIETVLCDARLSRLLLDPLGTVVSLTSVKDEITLAQRRAVSARDRHCVAKGCTRPPAFCDVHHLHHRADGGATTVDNLVLLCRRHHVLWHLGKLALHDLHVPWIPQPEPDDHGHDPWDDRSPPLVA
jgi:hypothetical protein